MDIFELRRRAASDDLKDRRLEKNYTLDDELPEDLFALMVLQYQHCKCGNIITVEDRDNICHQCRIERRTKKS